MSAARRGHPTFGPLARGPRAAPLFAFAAIAAFAAVAAALVSQHAFGMEPCPWCVLQRLVFGVLIAILVFKPTGLLGQQLADRA